MRRALWLLAALPMVPAAVAQGAPAAGVTRDVGTAKHAHRHVPVARAASLSYMGGPVLHSNRTHLIFWQPTRSGLSFDPGYASTIETFLSRVAADSHLPTNLYGLTGQYGDGAPAAYDSSYGGATLDTDPLPTPSGCAEPPPPPTGTGPGWTACVSDQQIAQEISRFVNGHRLPATKRDVYFLVTPAGLGDCLLTGPDNCALGGSMSGYCGYHSQTSDLAILYAVIPYNAVPGHCQSDNPRPNSSTADPAISTLAHEHAEVVTDPVRTSWFDSQSNNIASQSDEIADLCITNYGPNLGGSSGADAYTQLIHGGHYYIQELWSNADGACTTAARPDVVAFAAPSTIFGDRSLPLSGVVRAAHGRIVSYRWSFGDGHTASGRRVAHVFTRAREETVRLRTTDSWGNWAFASQAIRVTKPPLPEMRITGAPPRLTSARRPGFRFSSSAAIAAFECRVDSGPWAPCRSPTTTHRLSKGGHRFSVRARDTFGQLGRRPASYGFRIA